MSEYTPDCWVILELDNAGIKHKRVFAGWYGGYLGGDSWKMNSGITKIKEEKNWIHFYGESGSVYHCHRKAYGLSGYMALVLKSFLDQQTDTMKIRLTDDYDPEKH